MAKKVITKSEKKSLDIKREQIRQYVKEKLAVLTGMRITLINDDLLISDIGLDSIQTIELLAGIKVKFNLEINAGKIFGIKTLGDFLRLACENK